MIHSIRANDPRFKTVRLREGLNILLADTTATSTAQDTRNGVGKTLLMEVLHFCLGAGAPRDGGLARAELNGWTFTVELDVSGSRAEATRSLASPNTILVAGGFEAWPITPTWDSESASFRVTVAEWREILGAEWLSLNDTAGGVKYRPSFRSVFPYFARARTGAYETPFKYFSGQREWQKQVSVAFLLDLNWPDASRFQELKDQRDALRTLKRAMEQGAFGDPEQTLGRLRTQRIRLASQIESLANQLEDFEVHPEYSSIATQANELTSQLHELVNERVVIERKVTLYQEQAVDEQGPDAEQVVRLFEQAGVELSADVRRTLAEAQHFHAQVVSNRRSYLRDEMDALRRRDMKLLAEIEGVSSQRAQLLEILETKHALDELSRLNERLAELRAQLADVDSQIARITEIEERQGALEISAQELTRDSRREQAEREPQWRDAVELFAANTEALYGVPGELVIDLNDNGFQFNVNIPRSGSHGVDNMKIFAFDLMLAQRWAGKAKSPRTLWHDSGLFDGVDERQVGAALQLAASEAEQRGFQYFCSLNSDDLPPRQYLGDLDITPILTLTDATADGGLFGIRF